MLYRHFRDSLRARVMAILTIATTVFAIVFTVGLLLHGNTKAKQGDYIERTAQGQDGVSSSELALENRLRLVILMGCMRTAYVPRPCIQRGRVAAPGWGLVADHWVREVQVGGDDHVWFVAMWKAECCGGFLCRRVRFYEA